MLNSKKPVFVEIIENLTPLIYDGAMGTQLQKTDLSSLDIKDRPLEYLYLVKPDIVRNIHEKYLDSGANVVETNTFGANWFKLSQYNLEKKVYKINRIAAETAVKSLEKYRGSRPVFAAGAMGPSGFLPSSSDRELNRVTFDDLALRYKEQAAGLMDGGVDVLLLETMQDLLEVRAALYGISALFREIGRTLPVQVQVTMDVNGKMLLGSDISAFVAAVNMPVVSVAGLNCSTGPREMAPHIKAIIDNIDKPVSMLPNAGMPENVDGKAVYRMDADSFSEIVSEMVVNHGLSVAGGCCGTSYEHIKALSEKLMGKKRGGKKRTGNRLFLGTSISAIDIDSVSRPVIIGEKLNVQGSRKSKKLLLERRMEDLYRIGEEQFESGASLLDLNTAMNERESELEDMVDLSVYLSQRIQCGLCIDSTEYDVLEAALKKIPSAVMINSMNYENGGKGALKISRLAADFGCPVIALPIDDSGMAKSLERKLEIADKLYDAACINNHLPVRSLYFDPLVFTVTSGDSEVADSANVALEALKKVKERYPGIKTIMGVSNVSFGLKTKARRILNNVLLHHAFHAGLDAAIFNPFQVDRIEEYDKEIVQKAEDLLFNRKSDALSCYLESFEAENVTVPVSSIKGERTKDGGSPEEMLKYKIHMRDPRELEEVIDQILEKKSARMILDDILLPAMGEVGDKMDRRQLILPFVLQAAEVMKKALDKLYVHMHQEDVRSKGKFIIATVRGDVHDIGKNLVGTLLKSQGYSVLDLGKQVPVEKIIETVRKEKPDAVGLSALLVTTSKEMEKTVKEFDRSGINIPVLIGGAAVNRKFAERISNVEQGREYAGGVFYAKDAFEAADLLKRLRERDGDNTSKKDESKELSEKNKIHKKVIKDRAKDIEYGDLIIPPFYGTGEILNWKTEDILENIDRTRLFKGYWRGGKLDKNEFEKSSAEEFEPVYGALCKMIIENNLINARGYYSFFPVIKGNETQIIFLDPSDMSSELVSFEFPRIEALGYRSIADYFRPEGDVAGVQIVTVGNGMSKKSGDLINTEGNYKEGFYLNAMAGYITEYLAERVSIEIRKNMGLSIEVGKRYSFGYRGMPGLDEQKALLDIICAEDRLGITLTEGFLMKPEHSTAAVFVHHKDARY